MTRLPGKATTCTSPAGNTWDRSVTARVVVVIVRTGPWRRVVGAAALDGHPPPDGAPSGEIERIESGHGDQQYPHRRCNRAG
jgi:hypothetical protein